jgi:hypothetical protein
VPYLTLHREDVWGIVCIDPCILDLGISWRWVVSFTPRLLYLQGKIPLPMGKKVGWVPKSVWTTWREEIFCFYIDSNSEPSTVQLIASRYTGRDFPPPPPKDYNPDNQNEIDTRKVKTINGTHHRFKPVTLTAGVDNIACGESLQHSKQYTYVAT